jgi:hypothetical protein
VVVSHHASLSERIVPAGEQFFFCSGRRDGWAAALPDTGRAACNRRMPTRRFNEPIEPMTAGRPVLGIPELRVLDFADPLLLVVNLTRPVRALGTALESTLSD